MTTDHIYHETAAWRFYHNDFSNYVVWLDGKPWDSQDSLEKVLEIFRLSEIDYVVSMTGEIFVPSDGTLTCIATHDPFIVDEPDAPIHLIYPSSGTVEIMNARTLCQLTHFATLKDFREALAKHEDVPYILCDALK